MFSHLHVHTEYSTLDGMCKIEELILRVKELGQKAIAITDHGSMAGHYEFQEVCRKHKIKPILGCEFYMSHGEVATSEDNGYHVIAFAKNQTGLQNLYRLQAEGYKNNFYRKPNINFDMMKKYKEGVIYTSACIGGIISQLILKDPLEGRTEAQKWLSAFGDDFYLEIQPNDLKDQWIVNKELIKISEELNIKLIATNDVHYILKEDADIHEVLLALQLNKKWDDENRWKFPTKDYWLKSTNEMLGSFKGYNDSESVAIAKSIVNTQEIVDKCDAEIIKGKFLPTYPKLDGLSEDDYLADMTWRGFEKKYPPSYPNRAQIRKDIMEELQVISETGYSGYFINVADYITDARKNGVLVGDGRGSGCGSKVVYCIDITNVDPVPHNLLFERFLARGRTPDLDVDFSDQEHVFKHLQDLHGVDNVARVATYGKLTCKNVIRKVMSCFGFSQKEIAIINGSLPPNLDVTVEQAYNSSEKFKKFMDENKFIASVIRRLENTVSHEGKHAGGFVIYDNLTSLTPCKYENDSKGNRCIPVVQFDKYKIEDCGFYKMDVLGLTNLTTVYNCLEMIEQNEGIKIDLDEIDFEDEEVYEMLRKGDVSGVFQLANQASMIQEQRTNCFNDLIALNALIRPGVGDFKEYLKRRFGATNYEILEPRKWYMQETYGLITYQEQFLLDCKTFAGWSIAYADKHVRKNKHIKEDTKLKYEFIEDTIMNGYTKDIAEQVWQEIEDAVSGGYSFNKSHATSYAVLSYKTAWLKHYYPVYWYASLLTTEIDDQDMVEGLIAECKEKNIKILPPDINMANYTFVGSKEGIRIPINYMKGIGQDVIKYIKKYLLPIKSLDDMLDRGLRKYIKKNVVISMIKGGIFDFENEDREHLLWQYDMRNRKKTDIKNGVECPHQEYNEKIKLQWEKEVYGLYLSKHPLESRNVTKLKDYPEGAKVIQVIEKKEVIERFQKNGKKFAFLMGSNQHGAVKCMIFGDLWAEKDIQKTIEENDVLLVKGKKSKDAIIVWELEGIKI